VRALSSQDKKPRKIRRRRATGRVAGTTQSAFASNSMSNILKQQADAQARKKEKPEEDGSERKDDDKD